MTNALDRGRDAFERWGWADAFAELSAADDEAELQPEDLERLALAARMAGTSAWATTFGRAPSTSRRSKATRHGRRGTRFT